jgi:hypothetical protein
LPAVQFWLPMDGYACFDLHQGHTTLIVCCVVEQRPKATAGTDPSDASSASASASASVSASSFAVSTPWTAKAPIKKRYGSAPTAALPGMSVAASQFAHGFAYGGTSVLSQVTAPPQPPPGAANRIKLVLAVSVRGALDSVDASHCLPTCLESCLDVCQPSAGLRTVPSRLARTTAAQRHTAVCAHVGGHHPHTTGVPRTQGHALQHVRVDQRRTAD